MIFYVAYKTQPFVTVVAWSLSIYHICVFVDHERGLIDIGHVQANYNKCLKLFGKGQIAPRQYRVRLVNFTRQLVTPRDDECTVHRERAHSPGCMLQRASTCPMMSLQKCFFRGEFEFILNPWNSPRTTSLLVLRSSLVFNTQGQRYVLQEKQRLVSSSACVRCYLKIICAVCADKLRIAPKETCLQSK